MSADGIRHEHRDLALGLLLVIASAVLARAFIFAVPTCTSTSGLARMLQDLPGGCGAPPFEAITI
jgi:hypothetical protein